MEHAKSNETLTELTDELLDCATGGGALRFFKAIFIGGTSSAPGGTGTDSGATATNAQGWVIRIPKRPVRARAGRSQLTDRNGHTNEPAGSRWWALPFC
jgi:hypothetical protein